MWIWAIIGWFLVVTTALQIQDPWLRGAVIFGIIWLGMELCVIRDQIVGDLKKSIAELRAEIQELKKQK